MTGKKWHHIFLDKDDRLAAVTLGFIFWMAAVTVCWLYLTLHGGALLEIPSTVVHLTLALGATKVTHKLAEHDWSKVMETIIGLFKKKS